MDLYKPVSVKVRGYLMFFFMILFIILGLAIIKKDFYVGIAISTVAFLTGVFGWWALWKESQGIPLNRKILAIILLICGIGLLLLVPIGVAMGESIWSLLGFFVSGLCSFILSIMQMTSSDGLKSAVSRVGNFKLNHGA